MQNIAALTFEKCELSYRLPDFDGNPFDTRQVRLFARILAPNGVASMVGGFYAGDGEFRIRFAPTVPARHDIHAQFERPSGAQLDAGESTIFARESHRPGYVRIASNGYTFQTDNGEPFYPIGSNLCWSKSNMSGSSLADELADMRRMLVRLAESGGTAFRIWANAPWAHHAVDCAMGTDHIRFGDINLAGCEAIDAIVQMAEELDLRLMFAIDAANNWGGSLEGSPYFTANGGPCSTTASYFDNAQARAMTREKLKYVAARWGYSPAVWCWEFWNEVDGCGIDQVNAAQQLAWHQEMAQVLRSADPVRHPITTSTGHPLNFRAMWSIPEIEIVQTHHYGYMDSVDNIDIPLADYHATNTALYRKPHIASELGVSWASEMDPYETDGSTLHNALWSCAILPNSCAPGFFWYWDGYIDRHDLYHQYRGIANFLRGERWNEVQTSELSITLEDLPERVFEPPINLKVTTTLSGSDYYRSIFTVDNDGIVPGGHLIPNTYYGFDKPYAHFRTTLRVDFPMPGEFTAMVFGGADTCNGIVSAGNASGAPIAEIRVDGEVALHRPVSIRREPGSIDLYSDRLTVAVTQGEHEIEVENAGEGSFVMGHIVLTNYRQREARARVQGLKYDGTAIFWIYNPDYCWAKSSKGLEVEPVSGATVAISGMSPGRYRFVWWDTVRGLPISTTNSETGAAGILRSPVPCFVNDIACKCVMIGS